MRLRGLARGAQISSNEWAIGSRGFNSEFANKLLVLIDGRSVYSPVSGGVFWNAQDIMIDDVERIEVIRGPGATLWGANAVNGVINIITKRAQDSQGTLVTAAYGTDLSRYAARYGGTLGTDFSFRSYVQYADQEGLDNLPRTLDTGASQTIRGGFRIDGALSPADTITLQGDKYASNASNVVAWVSLNPPGAITGIAQADDSGYDVLGRWTHDYSSRSTLSIQMFSDHVVEGYGFGTEHLDTYDIEIQHRILIGSAHDVLWGTDFQAADATEQSNSFDIIWSPAQRDIRSWSAFIQDEITLVPERLKVTAGTKLEYDNIDGSNVLPNLRLSFTPGDRQTLWAAVSRAAARPDLFNLDGRINVAASQSPGGPPVLISGLPDATLAPEELLAYEAGYRFAPQPALSFDFSSFVNHYRHLIVYVTEPAELELDPAPAHVLIPLRSENALSAETHGLEAALHWQVSQKWQLNASYTWEQINARSDPSLAGASPRQQFQVRSYLDLPLHLELNAALYYVDAVTAPQGLEQITIAPYVRADLGVDWKPARQWSVGIWGQNLIQRDHSEFPLGLGSVVSEVPRTVTAKIVGTF